MGKRRKSKKRKRRKSLRRKRRKSQKRKRRKSVRRKRRKSKKRKRRKSKKTKRRRSRKKKRRRKRERSRKRKRRRKSRRKSKKRKRGRQKRRKRRRSRKRKQRKSRGRSRKSKEVKKSIGYNRLDEQQRMNKINEKMEAMQKQNVADLKHFRLEQLKHFIQHRKDFKNEEHEQFVNGLKGFLTAFKTLSNNERVPIVQHIHIHHKHPFEQQTMGNMNMMNHMPNMPMTEQSGFHRRLMIKENEMNLIGISKCLFYNQLSEVCVEYNYLNGMVSLNVITADNEINDDNDLKNIYYIVQQLEFVTDECVEGGDDMMLYTICMSKDDDNEYLFDIISDNKDDKMRQIHWNGLDNEWNEIIKFDDDANHIQKCVDLDHAKLCVVSNENDTFVIELRLKM